MLPVDPLAEVATSWFVGVVVVAVGVLALACAAVVRAVVERRRLLEQLTDLSSGYPVFTADTTDSSPSASSIDAAVVCAREVLADARRRADHERDARRRMQRALRAIPEGVVVVDDEGEIVFRNDVAEEFATARHGDALVEAAIREMVAVAVTEGHAGERQLDLFGPPRRTLVISARPLLVDSRAVGALAIVQDITERRRLEAIRRDFVANISHELKTPVGALSLLAETLAEEDDPLVSRRLAARMVNEALRLGNTIDDLLVLSRIESEDAAECESVPIVAVVAEAVNRIEPAAQQASIRIDAGAADPNLAVAGDRRQLVSALYNLLDNAVKYSDIGSTITVRATTDGRQVDLAVADQGIGIPARDLERIFERFYRVDLARSRQTGGTGLGLSIVRHVMANHEGEVTLDSRLGEGSTFTLRLPLVATGPVAVTDGRDGRSESVAGEQRDAG